MTKSGRPRYTTPGPGSYNVSKASEVRYAKPRLSSFSNSMCRYGKDSARHLFFFSDFHSRAIPFHHQSHPLKFQTAPRPGPSP